MSTICNQIKTRARPGFFCACPPGRAAGSYPVLLRAVDFCPVRVLPENLRMNISTPHNTPRKGYRKHALRVDMTPMVDLGFLLITFFVFTTSMMTPKAMKLAMPDDTGDPTPVKCSESFSIIVRDHDRISWFGCTDGQPDQPVDGFVSDLKPLRQALIGKLTALRAAGIDPRNLVVLIKPLDQANYQAVVDVLDEMTINGIRRYALVDPGPEER